MENRHDVSTLESKPQSFVARSETNLTSRAGVNETQPFSRRGTEAGQEPRDQSSAVMQEEQDSERNLRNDMEKVKEEPGVDNGGSELPESPVVYTPSVEQTADQGADVTISGEVEGEGDAEVVVEKEEVVCAELHADSDKQTLKNEVEEPSVVLEKSEAEQTAETHGTGRGETAAHVSQAERERRDEPETSGSATPLDRVFSVVQQAVQCIGRSLARVTHEDFRTSAQQSMQMLAAGDLSPLEQCFSNLVADCSGMSDQVFPCAAHSAPERETAGTPKPPPILMIVNTPAGPYIRVVPNGLVDEAVKQGLVREDDVQLQREFPFYQSKQSMNLA
ncbi:hypothetical protein BESB_039850 [Besnoitia besnoiti]|uniref:Uncharacterized protein n=1 Tax=Besnoitia besnoiti TaxID=94643 RepID=A0A2A9MNN4_BESBE|nr:hypothetical protein BESB_039850 [Besnoitia besnoiti]PFH37527.1 hypothetical protein BESB_039850 [Besnoitia besnoiti]